MSELRIIGAGMWRTGTVSLRAALQQLTGQSVLHMTEVMADPIQIATWLKVVTNQAPPRWEQLLRGYGSTLDWPSMAYWQELCQRFPTAHVLLSTRDPEEWWNSISRTVLLDAPTKETAKTPWEHLVVELFERKFVGRFPTHDQAIAAYNQHNQQVRAAVPASRLIEWTFADGWAPLASALGQPIPSQPFPHLNTTADWQRHHPPS